MWVEYGLTLPYEWRVLDTCPPLPGFDRRNYHISCLGNLMVWRALGDEAKDEESVKATVAVQVTPAMGMGALLE